MHTRLFLLVSFLAVSSSLPPGGLRAQSLLHELHSPTETEMGYFGGNTVTVPDTDGDGHDDVLIHAGNEGVGGKVYLYSGASGALLHEFSSPNAVHTDGFGFGLAGLPDVDGDGRGDVLAGAYFEYVDGLKWAGRAYVFSGATGNLVRTLVSPNEQELGLFGYSAAAVPDADGDGIADFLLGAYGEAEPGKSSAGHAYLFSGATGTLLRTLVSPRPTFAGLFGHAVAGMPDADGDGRGDVLVQSEGEDKGRVYGFSGATGALLYSFGSPNAATLDGYFAERLAGSDDLDGDGRGDFLIGSPLEDHYIGRAYLYSGATGTLLHELQSPNPQTSGDFGANISAVPDVDGDGRPDVGVGAPREGPGDAPEESGRAYVFSGATGALLQTLISPNEQAFGYFSAIAGVADLDGDGRGDFFIGASAEESGSSPEDAGRVYIFSSGEGEALSVAAEPVNPPIVIPAGGGAFTFTASVTNSGSDSETFSLWTRITRPDGEQTNKGLGPYPRTLAPGASFQRTFSQTIPGKIAAGTYTYTAYAGTYPDGAVASDTFTFTKSP